MLVPTHQARGTRATRPSSNGRAVSKRVPLASSHLFPAMAERRCTPHIDTYGQQFHTDPKHRVKQLTCRQSTGSKVPDTPGRDPRDLQTAIR